MTYSTPFRITPPFRVSGRVKPLFSFHPKNYPVDLAVSLKNNTGVYKLIDEKIPLPGSETGFQLPLNEFAGRAELSVDISYPELNITETHQLDYEIIESGARSTRLLDGLWVSLVHWDDNEAVHFNDALKKMPARAWSDQLRYMSGIGVKTVIIQNLFHSNEYCNNHSMTCENYAGQAFYPSGIYATRYGNRDDDFLETILSTADELGMYVFPGIGLFAWFDFTPESLKWHKEITREVFERYGHHPSLYGWYISEEMFGSFFYEDKKFYYPSVVDDMECFFKEYRDFTKTLSPLKPVMLAINHAGFEKYVDEWTRVLKYIDILSPFGYARDPSYTNLKIVENVCETIGCKHWIDLEVFKFPLSNGLQPKSMSELETEIKSYDSVEQILGYQFTGLMDHPDSGYHLGGVDATKLFLDYKAYYTDMLLPRK